MLMSLRKAFHLSYATVSQLQSMEEICMRRHLSVFERRLVYSFIFFICSRMRTKRTDTFLAVMPRIWPISS